MTSEYSLSVVVPLYNEAELLENSLIHIAQFLSRHFADFEIVVIESGSTDGSDQLCDAMARTDPHIKVLHEGARNGLGSALRVGFKNAVKDIVWMITVDLPFPLEAILRALPLLAQYDCVLSYRSSDPRHLFRRIQSFAYNVLVKRILRLGFRSINSAFKVFKRPVIQNMVLTSYGTFIEAEILYQVKKQGISYVEIPVDMIERSTGKSSVGFLTWIYVLKELARFTRTKDLPKPS